MLSTFLHSVIAFILATNYFAFQIELFEDEYEANHPKTPEAAAYGHTSLTWESFDKDNAQPVIVPCTEILVELFPFPNEIKLSSSFYPPFKLIRDKSPPDLGQQPTGRPS